MSEDEKKKTAKMSMGMPKVTQSVQVTKSTIAESHDPVKKKFKAFAELYGMPKGAVDNKLVADFVAQPGTDAEAVDWGINEIKDLTNAPSSGSGYNFDKISAEDISKLAANMSSVAKALPKGESKKSTALAAYVSGKPLLPEYEFPPATTPVGPFLTAKVQAESDKSKKIEFLADALQETVKQASEYHGQLKAIHDDHQKIKVINAQLEKDLQAAADAVEAANNSNNQLSKALTFTTTELTKTQAAYQKLQTLHSKLENKVWVLEDKMPQLQADFEDLKHAHVDKFNKVEKELEVTKFEKQQLESALTKALADHANTQPGSTVASTDSAVKHALLKVRELRGRHLEALIAEALELDNEEADWAVLPKAWSLYDLSCPKCLAKPMKPVESHKNGHGFLCGNNKCLATWKNTNPQPAAKKKAEFDRIQAVQTLVLELGFDIDMAEFTVDSAGARRVLDFVKKVPTIHNPHADALKEWVDKQKSGLTNEVLTKVEVDKDLKADQALKSAKDKDLKTAAEGLPVTAKAPPFNAPSGVAHPEIMAPAHPDLGTIATPTTSGIASVEVLSQTTLKVSGVYEGQTFTAQIVKPESFSSKAWDKVVANAVASPSSLSAAFKSVGQQKLVAQQTAPLSMGSSSVPAPAPTPLPHTPAVPKNVSEISSIANKIKKALKDSQGLTPSGIAKALAADPEIAALAQKPQVLEAITAELVKSASTLQTTTPKPASNVAAAKVAAHSSEKEIDEWASFYEAIQSNSKKLKPFQQQLNQQLKKETPPKVTLQVPVEAGEDYNPIDLIPKHEPKS